jgi:hypothetical protein
MLSRLKSHNKLKSHVEWKRQNLNWHTCRNGERVRHEQKPKGCETNRKNGKTRSEIWQNLLSTGTEVENQRSSMVIYTCNTWRDRAGQGLTNQVSKWQTLFCMSARPCNNALAQTCIHLGARSLYTVSDELLSQAGRRVDQFSPRHFATWVLVVAVGGTSVTPPRSEWRTSGRQYVLASSVWRTLIHSMTLFRHTLRPVWRTSCRHLQGHKWTSLIAASA